MIKNSHGRVIVQWGTLHQPGEVVQLLTVDILFEKVQFGDKGAHFGFGINQS